MEAIVLAAHLVIAIVLVGVIMLQRSEGGGLGIGGGGGGGGGAGGFGLFSARGQANALSRTTAIFAALFMITSMTLAILAGGHRQPTSILDSAPQSGEQAPAAPAVPLSQ